jgi:hypothetical protein
MGTKSLLADTIIDCDDENCTAGGTVSGSVSSCYEMYDEMKINWLNMSQSHRGQGFLIAFLSHIH